MENRFGVRDLIQATLLLAIIVAIVVSMIQIDRQWDIMQKVAADLKDQTSFSAEIFKQQKKQAHNPQILELRDELVKLRKTLEKGVVVAGVTTQPATNATASAASSGNDDSVADETDKDVDWGPVVGKGVDPFARIEAVRQKADYHEGDYYVDMFGVTPDKLTPLISTDAYGSAVQSQILESLAQRDPQTLKWEPLIARWWRISKDGLKIEFALRRDVNFSDGKPLTADDVVFTYNWIMNPDVECPRDKSYYEKISSVKKIGSDRVLFTFSEPYYQAFELAGGMGILAKHFYSNYTPQQFSRSTGLLMGSGPYRLENPRSWTPEPGKPITIYRNERYWGPSAPFDRIMWRVIKEESTRLTAFRNGETDVIYPTPEQYILMNKDEKLLAKTQHFEYQSPTAGYLYIGWAQKKDDKPTIFADRRVRQAMTLLINREHICKEIFDGYATPVTGPFSPLSPQTDPNVRPWPYDVARAKALLAEAGFKDTNGDGVLDGPDGRPLSIKLSFPSSSNIFNRVILYIKDSFAKAGIIVESDPLEWSVLLQRINQRSLEAYSLGWSGSIESDPYQIFHSSMIKGTGDNAVSYASPKLDKLIEEARSTVDEDKRMILWRKVHDVLHEDQPYTFLLTRKSLIFADKRIQNMRKIRLGLTPMTEWYVPQDLIKWKQP